MLLTAIWRVNLAQYVVARAARNVLRNLKNLYRTISGSSSEILTCFFKNVWINLTQSRNDKSQEVTLWGRKENKKIMSNSICLDLIDSKIYFCISTFVIIVLFCLIFTCLSCFTLIVLSCFVLSNCLVLSFLYFSHFYFSFLSTFAISSP